MKSYLLTLSILALLFITGCKKSDNNNAIAPTDTKIYLLTKQVWVSVNGLSTDTSYSKYDAKDRIIEVYNPRSASSYKYTYDSNDRVTRCDALSSINTTGNPINSIQVNTKVSYYYTGNTAIAMDTVKMSDRYGFFVSQTVSQISFTFNSNQQVTKLDYGAGKYNLYTYDDLGNNVSEEDHNLTTSIALRRYAYTYDQNKSPYYSIKGNIFLINQSGGQANHNNNVNYAFTDMTASGSITTNQLSKNVYEYNAAGYPVKQVGYSVEANGSQAPTGTTYYFYITK